MNARIRWKFVRSAERMVAEACRLYVTRPRDDDGGPLFEELSRRMLSLSLRLAFAQWSQHGERRFRRWEVRDVQVDMIEDAHDRVVVAGSVTRWDRRSGAATGAPGSFRVVCPLPSLVKTPRSVRPLIVLGVSSS